MTVKTYQATLNLPRTDFPMQAKLIQREPELLAFWENLNLFERLNTERSDRPKFILHDGPPYANGALHVGHALNKLLKDMVIKSKYLSGYSAPFVPGWDCHGLPIELNIEKKYGKPGVKLDAQAFRALCRAYAQDQVSKQCQSFKRLGVLGDWEHPYLTMQSTYEADTLRALAQFFELGYVTQGFLPVHFCVDCGSSLSEAEVIYENKASEALDIAFTVDQASRPALPLPLDRPVHIPIWTTTPWTLPANQAVALHKKLLYALVEVESPERAYFIVAKALVDGVMQRYGFSRYTILSEHQGQVFEGLGLSHPFEQRIVPVILGDHVSDLSGTGAVHTAPDHGLEDYHVAQKYGLKMNHPLDRQARFKQDQPPETAFLAGHSVFKAEPLIIARLKQSGKLLHQETLQHSYPYCWRHRTPVIYLATPQWFVSMQAHDLRQRVLNAIETVNFTPSWGKPRLSEMIRERPDWCLSRQRHWGVPLAVFVHKQTGALHKNTIQLMHAIADKIEKQGIEAWFDCESRAFLPEAEAKDYEPVRDILDVWFDSGLSYACVLMKNPSLGYPADLYLEGTDQYRGWFHTALLSSVAVNGKAPYRQVLTHGYTVDEQGRKMSKSLGNVVGLDQTIERYGAEMLRLWVAASDVRTEVAFSDAILKQLSEHYRRIRNTARFLLSNLFDFDPTQHGLLGSNLLDLDAWILNKVQNLQVELMQAYEHYQFHLVFQKIYQFCSFDLGSVYLDIIKDRLYTLKADSHARRSAQTAVYHTLQALVRWLAPILSFTAEDIWQHMPFKDPSKPSVLMTTFYSDFPEKGVRLLEQIEWIEACLQIRLDVNRALEAKRQSGEIRSALEASVSLYLDPDLKAKLQPLALAEELRFFFITSELHLLSSEDKPEAWQGDTVVVNPCIHPKCQRCWHRTDTVGLYQEDPHLCARCFSNVFGPGESRAHV